MNEWDWTGMFSYVLAVLVGNVGKDGFGQLHSKCHSCVQRQIPMFLMTSERDHCTWLSLVDLVDRNLDNFGMSFFCHACATCSEKREQGTSMHRCIHMHPTFFNFFFAWSKLPPTLFWTDSSTDSSPWSACLQQHAIDRSLTCTPHESQDGVHTFQIVSDRFRSFQIQIVSDRFRPFQIVSLFLHVSALSASFGIFLLFLPKGISLLVKVIWQPWDSCSRLSLN